MILFPHPNRAIFAGAYRHGTLPGALSAVLQLEISYLGYTQQSDGWTMFGQWYADNVAFDQSFARADWCAMFQTYCMRACGIPNTIWPDTSPQGSAVSYLATWLANQGFEYNKNLFNMPAKYDIVLYSWTSDPNSLDHVGMVASVSGSTPNTAVLTVIEGNKGGQVGYRTINYMDSQVARIFRL